MKITPTHAALRRINAALNGIEAPDPHRSMTETVIEVALDDISDDWRVTGADDEITHKGEEAAVMDEVRRIVPYLHLNN